MKMQRTVVCAFIHRSGKVLLAKRKEDEDLFPDQYEMPGGKVKWGETPEDALKRELAEELSIKVRVGEPFNCFSYFSGDGSVHFVETDFLAEMASSDDEIRLNEHVDARWFGPEDIGKIRVSDEARKALVKGFRIVSSQKV